MSVAVPLARVVAARRLLSVVPAVAALFVLLFAAPFLVLGGGDDSEDFGPGGLPAGATPFVGVYQDAARAFNVSPFLLMAVHEDETNYSTAALPGVSNGLNSAGCCAGPMQFSIAGAASSSAGGAGGTWAAYSNAYRRAHIERPPDYPGRFTEHTPNVYDSFDSIYAAASYFHSLGARAHLDDRTLNALASYKGTPPASLPFARHDYERAMQLQQLAAAAPDSSGDAGIGDVDGTPLDRVIAYADKIESLRLPYCWGGGHAARVGPSPGISYCHAVDHGRVVDTHTPGLDCSGSVRWLLTLTGLPDPGGIGSGSFATAYDPGPGRHVTIWSNADHVFVTIDGHGWGTSQTNYRNGPGWAAHTTAGFTASHPHGL